MVTASLVSNKNTFKLSTLKSTTLVLYTVYALQIEETMRIVPNTATYSKENQDIFV